MPVSFLYWEVPIFYGAGTTSVIPYQIAYYIKGDNLVYIPSLRGSIKNGFNILYVFIPAFMLSLRDRKTLRMGIAFAIPIFGSIGMSILLSDAMNFGGRSPIPPGCYWRPILVSIG